MTKIEGILHVLFSVTDIPFIQKVIGVLYFLFLPR